MKRIIFFISFLLATVSLANAQTSGTSSDTLKSVAVKDTSTKPAAQAPKDAPKEAEKKWYDKLSIRGYAQIRYNRLLATNDNLRCDQCDKSMGAPGGIFLRRARLVFSGNVHERVFIYVQVDYAQGATNGSISFQNFLNIRDAYGDIYLNKTKTFRTRVGVSKVPYSFDNLQSSQNRLAFDRSDAMNSAAYNERDMGIYLMYTPSKIADRFKMLVSEGLKGTGDYGVFALGIYNGQTLNRVEYNDSFFVAARASYPFLVGTKQIIEIGVSGIHGYANLKEAKSSTVKADLNQLEQRIAASFTLFPQPFGVQAEYSFGKGPEFHNAGDTALSIKVQDLQGGYVQLMYRKKIGKHYIIPYSRYQYYNGGKRIEKDARSYTLRDWETGIEWTPFKAVEITAAYLVSDRRYEDSGNLHNRQKGNMLRLQLQFNY